MKIKSVLLVLVVALSGFLFIACANDDGGSVPVISDMYFSDSRANLDAGIKIESFLTNSDVWIGFTVTDQDKDVVSVTLAFEITDRPPQIINYDVPEMPRVSSFCRIVAVPGHGSQGTYPITVFVTDSKGNKSNSISETITISD